jgi:hypothetical protein
MNNFYRFCLSIVLVVLFYTRSNAQDLFPKPVKIAVFAPLYLGEAFDGNTYRYSKTSLPKNLLPGLEFYHGVMLAVDKLAEEGVPAEIAIYDIKQSSTALANIFLSPDFLNTGLMIASITNPTELKFFADQALVKNIPLISATYPNYIGINANPNFVLLNSSLHAHLEGLYKHMQKEYAGNTIIAVKKSGSTEDYIQNIFNSLNKTTNLVPLKIKWITLDEDAISSTDLLSNLDSAASNNVVFVASPTENFGLKVVRTLSNAGNYRVTAIGMPTWDGISGLNSRDCRNVDVVYSTPFYFLNNSSIYDLTKDYRAKYGSRPSDLVFKGYECTLHFAKLIAKHKQNFAANINDKDYYVFNQFDLQPVKSKKSKGQVDFLENKKLYFVKKQQGNVKSVTTN